MRKTLLLLIAVSFASTAFFVQPVHAQTPSDVEGMVCVSPSFHSYAEDAPDCSPGAPDAEVRIQNSLAGVSAVDRTAMTHEDGGFRFADVPEGDYKLTVTRAGFEPYEAELSVPGDGGTHLLTPLEVEVSGQLLDADGEPLSEAYVSFWGGNGGAEAKSDNGAFQVTLLAGWYEVNVEASGHGSLRDRMFIDGSDLTLQMAPIPERDAVASGQIVDQDGAPVADATIVAEQWEVRSGSTYQYGDYRNSATSDADGQYSLDVYSGNVNLRFQKDGHAMRYHWLEIASGDEATQDVELLRYPEKTAKIEGKITGTGGAGLRYVSISLNHPEYGIYECSVQSSGEDPGQPKPAPASSEGASADSMIAEPYPYYEDCAITVEDDGSFSGMVTPGYAILNVYHDHWRTCSESTDSDGSYRRDCGPQYYSHVQTLDLEAEATTTLNIAMKARPAPNAVISGYVVDQETQKAIPQVHISFNNEATYGWGSATTDGDGSYKVRLHGGLQRVHVWADGYLPWEGQVDLKAGDDLAFDIFLKPGQQNYGYGCCYAYAEGDMARGEAVAPGGSGSAGGSDGAAPRAAPSSAEAAGSSDSSESGEAFEDLGGGLGPYDAAQRARATGSPSEGAPAPFALLLVGLGALALARRR